MDGKKQSILMDLIKDRKYILTKISAEKWVVFSETENKNKEIFLFTQPEYWGASLRERSELREHISKDKAQDVANDFMRKCLQETAENDCIIVCPEILFAVCSSYEDDYLEVISEQTISFNPIENENVPRHTFFDRIRPTPALETQRGALEREGTTPAPRCEGTEEFYPIISVNDPIVRWYGFKKGDIIKIERKYCGETYYRMVSN